MTTLFISDLHLSPQRPDITDCFLAFLAGEAREAEALYILGDFFESWAGDDLSLPEYPSVIAALKALTDSGVKTYFMWGNRDFMVGAQFAAATGVQMIEEPYTIDLYGTQTLLMHGDVLCTDDVGYQRLRRIVRFKPLQKFYLLWPLPLRRAIVNFLRGLSKKPKKSASKPPKIVDVHPDAVAAAMREAQVSQMIHGHTHRPACHDLILNQQPAQRIVLGDWYTQGSVLRATAQGLKLGQLSFV